MDVGKLFESRKMLLWLCGIWPEDSLRHPHFSQFRLYFIASSQFFCCVYYAVRISIVSPTDNLPELIIEFCGFCLITSKFLPVARNRDQIVNLISATIKSGSSQERKDGNEVEIAKFWLNCADKIIKYFRFSYLTTITVYVAWPLVATSKTLPLNIIFAQDTFSSPWYEVTYGVQVFLLVIALTIFLTTDQAFVIFICQLSVKLKLLESLLLRDFWDANAGLKSRKDFLKFVIKRHVDVTDFGEEVRRALSDAFILQHFFTAVIVCFAAFTYLVTDDQALAKKMIFIIVQAVFLQFIICSAGEVITTRSESLLEAINLSELSCSRSAELDAITLRQMVLVIMRAQKPLRLSVGSVGIINFDFFAQTMKNEFSLFALLRTLYA